MSVNKVYVAVKSIDLDGFEIKETYLNGNVSNQTLVGNVSLAAY